MNQFFKKTGLDLSASEIINEIEKPTVIIVDDDLSSRMFLKIRVAEAGYITKDFKNGSEAWDYINSKRISVVIMEMKLPGLHGSELLRRIKKNYPKLPVIIYTSHPEFSGDMTVITHPYHKYIIKPVPIERIIETVKDLIQKVNEEKK